MGRGKTAPALTCSPDNSNKIITASGFASGKKCICTDAFCISLLRFCSEILVGRRLSDVTAVAVVAAAMLTQRWRLRPAHGASRPAQPLAEAVALTRRGCARRLRPSWPRSCRTWRDGHAAEHGVQVSANPPGLAGKALSIGCRPILLIPISRAAHRTRYPL